MTAFLGLFFIMGNTNLRNANRAKKDEFYTSYADIERECEKYRDQFEGKIIYCNCDDPIESNFFKYFANNFDFFKLKKLVTTHYQDSRATYKLEIDKKLDINSDGKIDIADVEKTPLKGNGDFRNAECIELLKEADIVITNPPFSMFREYLAQLIEYDKKFLIIGNQNAITYKEVFKLIKENKIWLGYSNNQSFVYKTPYPNLLEANRKFVKNKGYDPDDGYVKVPAINWYTNLDTKKRHEDLVLYKKYTPEEYPKYDNYDAINIDKISDIPKNYAGKMGVPITFLDKYNPEQFEIVKFRKGDDDKDLVYTINGERKYPYFRVIIKNKKRDKL